MTPEIEERARKTACLNSLCENINCRMHSEMLKEIDTLRTQYGDAQMELGELKAEIDGIQHANRELIQTLTRFERGEEYNELYEKYLELRAIAESALQYISDESISVYSCNIANSALAKIRGE